MQNRLVGLALWPEPRPKARRPPTCFYARGDEPRRTAFELQGQHLVRMAERRRASARPGGRPSSLSRSSGSSMIANFLRAPRSRSLWPASAFSSSTWRAANSRFLQEEADDGIRTHDLLHGKRVVGSVSMAR